MSTYRQPPETEYIIAYRPGGLHPVHIGDKLKDGRYEVVRKLGCGAYATVWLVQDHTAGGYVALKILKADSDGREVEVMRRLQNGTFDHVERVLDLFEHVGPNGTHPCIVTEVLGPSLAAAEDDLEDVYETGVYPPEVAQSIAIQIAHALQELHCAGIVHGDLSKRNVLLYSSIIASWTSPADVDKYMTEPQTEPIRLSDGGEVAPSSPHRPTYTVYGLLSTNMTLACFTDPQNVRVKLCDFGEAFLCHPGGTVQRDINIPRPYASPEVLLHQPVGPPVDVWALAVLIHDLVACSWPLFARIFDDRADHVLAGMVLRKGKLPDRLWALWEKRSTYFDETGAWIGPAEAIPETIKEREPINEKITRERCGGRVSAFSQMICAMTEYDPEHRASIQEVLRLMTAIWTPASAAQR